MLLLQAVEPPPFDPVPYVVAGTVVFVLHMLLWCAYPPLLRWLGLGWAKDGLSGSVRRGKARLWAVVWAGLQTIGLFFFIGFSVMVPLVETVTHGGTDAYGQNLRELLVPGLIAFLASFAIVCIPKLRLWWKWYYHITGEVLPPELEGEEDASPEGEG
jgi:hypothetical protein